MRKSRRQCVLTSKAIKHRSVIIDISEPLEVILSGHPDLMPRFRHALSYCLTLRSSDAGLRARGAVAISSTPQEHRQEHCAQEGERQHAHQEKKRQQGFAPKMWIDPGFHGHLNSASNDEVERREVAATTTEADLSKSSTPSLARRGLTLHDPANDCNPGAISAWRIAAVEPTAARCGRFSVALARHDPHLPATKIRYRETESVECRSIDTNHSSPSFEIDRQ